MSKLTDEVDRTGFELRRAERGPWDGEFYIATCLSCDWASGRFLDQDGPFRKHGPATQHRRDKHTTPSDAHREGSRCST